MMKTPAKQPQPRGGSRKGRPNKRNATVKAAIEYAFNHVGGTVYLVQVAREDPKTFCALLGKLLPMQVSMTDAQGNGPSEITVKFIKADG